jgi:alkylation response protein AidB-like acyl-CoA dehydrogenase
MVDKQLADLKKKLSELSQKSPKKAPEPIREPAPVNDDLNTEEKKLLEAQIEKIEQKEVPQEAEELEEPNEEDKLRIQQLQAEVERLQNNGTFRAELIYQYLGLNTNLNRIAIALEKLGGANAEK